MTTLYEKLGGEAAINAVVDRFYDIMLTDPRVSHFYENTNLTKLRCRQKQFITLVSGGPSNYEGTDMKTAHCKLNISKEDFNITWEHLQESLHYFSVNSDLIDQLKQIFYSVEGQIVKSQQKCAVLEDSSSKSWNSKPILECPFKAKLVNTEQKPEVKEGNEQNCPIKLNNKAYLKWNY